MSRGCHRCFSMTSAPRDLEKYCVAMYPPDRTATIDATGIFVLQSGHYAVAASLAIVSAAPASVSFLSVCSVAFLVFLHRRAVPRLDGPQRRRAWRSRGPSLARRLREWQRAG